MSLFNELKRRNVIRIAIAYSLTAWVLLQIADVVLNNIEAPDWLFRAILLLVADTITRAVLPSEIPIGVLTALIGGPFFCYIFRKQQTARRGG